MNKKSDKAVENRDLNRRSAMNILIFYLIACLFMACSAYISGLMWKDANGPSEYLKLLLVERPWIVVATTVLFISSGVLGQIGKVSFNLTYYELSIIWIATVWVSVVMLWNVSGIKPSGIECVGYLFCQVGLLIVAISKFAA